MFRLQTYTVGMRRKAFTACVAATAIACGIGLTGYAAPLATVGTGFAAHNSCAVTFVADRGADSAQHDMPKHPMAKHLSTTVNAVEQSSTSSFYGFFSSTAYFQEGLGCTLAESKPNFEPMPARPLPEPDAPWPRGERQDTSHLSHRQQQSIAKIVQSAFGENSEDSKQLSTRAVVVAHRGKLVSEKYASGFTPGTRQLGWSLTKSVTNLMVGRLTQESVLSVSDDNLMPAWSKDARSQITIDNLLRMSSGLEWNENAELRTSITEMLYRSDDMAQTAGEAPLVRRPGGFQQYSSGTTNILCQVMREKSGLQLDMAAKLIYQPLHMSTALLEPDASGGLVCSSNMWAAPRDWAKVGQLALQKGSWEGKQLLPTNWMTYSTLHVNVETPHNGYGAHWWTNSRHDGSLRYPKLPADAYWAAGHNGQWIAVVPSAELVVVRMGNTPEGTDVRMEPVVAGLVASLA